MGTKVACAWLIPIVVLGCGGRSSGDARAICERAAERYAACIGELLGPEAAALARDKDGIAACAGDAPTVAMYRACLPVTGCEAFMDCLEERAASAAPQIGADLPRAEQCAQHVKDGLRAIAYGEATDEGAKDCVLDESRRWEDCLTEAEREVVGAYARQRQRECEAWSPQLAACVLGLPGRKACDPDSEPMWRLPLAEGPPGPAVAWSIEVRDDDDEGVGLGWAGGTLVVRDDDGLRGIQGGKVLWTEPATDLDAGLAIAGAWVAADRGGDRGLRLVEIATGARADALAGKYVEALGAAADRVLVLTGGGELHEVTPARCAKGRGCARPLGTLGDDALSYTDAIGPWQGGVVMASTAGIHVTDGRGQTRFHLDFDADAVALTPDGAVLSDSAGVAVLSLAGCAGLGAELELESTQEDPGGGCIVARREGGWISRIAALPGRAVAFNDDGLTERTHHVAPGAAPWQVLTAGQGELAGDLAHVYVVSLGFDRAGPVRLLALARKSGEVVWQTDLGVPPPDSPTVRIAVGDGGVAAQVGKRVLVTPTASR